VLGGFKFAVQAGLKPVYRRPRFDYAEGLLSGPAWAGVLAVLSARRNALRACLGEGAVRCVVVGALAAGLGVQVSTTPSVAQSAARGHANSSHSSAARHAMVGSGLIAGILKLSESDGDHRANAGNVLAVAERAPLGVGGAQGRGLPVPGMGAATTPGERIDLLSDIGLFDLSGAGGLDPTAGRVGNDGSDPRSSSDSGEPGSASDSSASVSPSDAAVPDVFGPQAELPVAVLAGRAGSAPSDIAGGWGPDLAPRSTPVFEDVHGPGPGGGGSPDLGVPGPSGGPPGSLDVPGPSVVPEAFHVPGLVGGGLGIGGVPEPATWMIMLVGLTLVGGSARQRRAQPLT
jgi:PEP-CTERM motif